MYLALKLVHVACVIVFLGNIYTGLFWHAHALRTADPRILAHTMAGILKSDRWFTNPGAAGVAIAGVALAIHAGMPLLGTRWIAATIALFAFSGLVYGFRVSPLQKRLLALATSNAAGAAFDLERYRALTRRWEAWGALALVAPLLGLGLMVLKPGH